MPAETPAPTAAAVDRPMAQAVAALATELERQFAPETAIEDGPR